MKNNINAEYVILVIVSRGFKYYNVIDIDNIIGEVNYINIMGDNIDIYLDKKYITKYITECDNIEIEYHTEEMLLQILSLGY